jgi:uncharacterized protein (DUF1330 family)
VREPTDESTLRFCINNALGRNTRCDSNSDPSRPNETPVYYVAEVDVTDIDGYLKEYAPKAAASSKAFGGQTLAAGQEITQIEGAPPKRRVVIVKWNSLEQLQAWRNSEQYKEDRKIGDKYAKTIRAFAVEGLPQN